MALGERSRNPFMPRSTAEAACAMRATGALENDPAVRCPDDLAGGFLGGFNITTLAKYRAMRGLMVRTVNRRVPGGYAYEIARAKFIDDVVLGETDRGLEELILLGAGLDSRPYRMAEQLRGVRVFEVDHPSSLESKRARLRRLLGQEPGQVSFVPVDFNEHDLARALADAGHSRSARTLFICSGVLPYLYEEGATELLTWVASHNDPPASIAFDTVWAEAIDGSRDYYGAAELRERVNAVGEPLRWGVPEDDVEGALASLGLSAERALDADELRSTYLTRSNGELFHRPFGFGALVHARARRG